MTDPNTDYPTTAADALETVEHLLRFYVPKNTSDAKFALAAINVLRRELSGIAGVVETPPLPSADAQVFINRAAEIGLPAAAKEMEAALAHGVLGIRQPPLPRDLDPNVPHSEGAASGVKGEAS